MSRPLKVQIMERARTLIADEQHWCRRHLALDANGVVVSPTSASAVKRCGLGAVIAAAYQLTHDFDAAHDLAHSCQPPAGDLGSSKNLDFQAAWHHFQLVRLLG